eukprot:2034202-Prymnesium_polylepis.1
MGEPATRLARLRLVAARQVVLEHIAVDLDGVAILLLGLELLFGGFLPPDATRGWSGIPPRVASVRARFSAWTSGSAACSRSTRPFASASLFSADLSCARCSCVSCSQVKPVG